VTTRRQSSLSPSATDVLLGLLLVAAGLVLLGGIYLKAIPSMAALSAFVGVAGLVGIAGAVVGRTSPGFFSEIVSGALLTVLGLVFIRFPDSPVATLQLVAGAFFAVNGIIRLASATEYPSLRGLMLVSGAGSLALAAAVFSDAVKPGFLALGTLIAVELLIDGISALVIGRQQHPSRR